MKHFLSLLFTFCMMLSFVPSSVVATEETAGLPQEDSIEEVMKTFDKPIILNLDYAIADFNEEKSKDPEYTATYALVGNETLTTDCTIPAGMTVTVDNGYTIEVTYDTQLETKPTVTLTVNGNLQMNTPSTLQILGENLIIGNGGSVSIAEGATLDVEQEDCSVLIENGGSIVAADQAQINLSAGVTLDVYGTLTMEGGQLNNYGSLNLGANSRIDTRGDGNYGHICDYGTLTADPTCTVAEDIEYNLHISKYGDLTLEKAIEEANQYDFIDWIRVQKDTEITGAACLSGTSLGVEKPDQEEISPTLTIAENAELYLNTESSLCVMKDAILDIKGTVYLNYAGIMNYGTTKVSGKISGSDCTVCNNEGSSFSFETGSRYELDTFANMDGGTLTGTENIVREIKLSADPEHYGEGVYRINSGEISYTINARICPVPFLTEEEKTVEWKIADENVATVTGGIFTRKYGGNTTFTVTATGLDKATAANATVTKQLFVGNSLVLPKQLKTIDDEAFTGTFIYDIVLQDGVTTIGKGAFKGNDNLRLVVIPDSVTSIAADAFSGCTNVTILCSEGSTAAAYAADNSLKCAYFGD